MTPIIKNCTKKLNTFKNTTEGMIPMIKNIRVVDEQGNQYGATYPKRAKGLVKKGRARFINDDVICLACPPDIYLEDIIMNNDNIKIEEEFAPTTSGKYTYEYALQQIEKITNDTTYVKEALKAIADMEPSDAPNGGMGDAARGTAIGEAINARESTNRKLIEFYSKMYEDLKPNKSNNPSSKELMQQMLIEKISTINICDVDDQSDFIAQLMNFAKELQ